MESPESMEKGCPSGESCPMQHITLPGGQQVQGMRKATENVTVTAESRMVN